MTEQPSTVTLTITPQASGFVRAMHHAAWGFTNTGRYLQGLRAHPVPPPPKNHSGMTARQYRAARRRYGREVRALRKAPPQTPVPPVAAGFTALAKGLARAQALQLAEFELAALSRGQ